jgi:hypothetical protein
VDGPISGHDFPVKRPFYADLLTARNLQRNGSIRGCIQKFPDWPPGARTANDTALCH